MATLSELQERLSKINDAIDQILLGNQEYELDDGQVDQRVKKANIEHLYKMQRDLENRIARMSGGGGFYAS